MWNEAAEQSIKRHSDVSTLADMLKEEHESALPKLEGFSADLMNAALSEVNWHEIAESLLHDAKAAMAD